jgi:hypothetical protein
VRLKFRTQYCSSTTPVRVQVLLLVLDPVLSQVLSWCWTHSSPLLPDHRLPGIGASAGLQLSPGDVPK